MAAVQFDNYYQTELTAAVAATDTTIHVMSVSSSILAHVTGGNWIYLTLVDANSWNNNLIPPAKREIVKVTAITGTGPYTLTVVRAADQNPPMTAQAFSRCDIAAFLLNAQTLYDMVFGGGGAVSITATLPATVTPSPITGTGVVGVNVMTGDSGAGGLKGAAPAPGAGDAAAGKFLKADATWAVPATGGSVSITGTTPIVVTPSPITGTGVVSHTTTAVTPGSYGNSTHVGQFTVNATGHLTAAANVAIASVGGSFQSQSFTTPGSTTWTVPAGVTAAWADIMPGGGGGSSTITASIGGGGGGAGEPVMFLAIPVTAAGTVNIVVGAGGAGGAAGQVTAQAGSDGGDSTVTDATIAVTWTAKGGKGAANTGIAGSGGGSGAGAGGAAANPGGVGVKGVVETSHSTGGGGGGGGGNTTSSAGGVGAASGPFSGGAAGTAASSQAGGGGGGSSYYGQGGAGGNGGVIGSNAASTAYGAGGGGGGGKATTTIGGGNGAGGRVVMYWIG